MSLWGTLRNKLQFIVLGFPHCQPGFQFSQIHHYLPVVYVLASRILFYCYDVPFNFHSLDMTLKVWVFVGVAVWVGFRDAVKQMCLICHFYQKCRIIFIHFKNDKYFFEVWAQTEINLENKSKGEWLCFSGDEIEFEVLTWVGGGTNDDRKIIESSEENLLAWQQKVGFCFSFKFCGRWKKVFQYD